MKILVINGSPRGKNSVTLFTTRYLQKHFPNDEFLIIDVASKINLLEKDFSECKRAMEDCEMIVVSFPVYTFLAPSQLHRFIALLKESDVNLSGKFFSIITTSKHFYDVTAIEYVKENLQDLSMKYIKGLSSDMNDLTTKKGRDEALSWYLFVKNSVLKNLYEIPLTAPYEAKLMPVSVPQVLDMQSAYPASETDSNKKTIVVVADLAHEDLYLRGMIDRFGAVSKNQVKLVNIHDFEFKGGCLGCLNCVTNGKCVYEDGFSKLLREEIQTGDAIVIAFSVKDHSMGPIFKTYDDRQFCNGHRTVTEGIPFGYLVSGNLSKEPNLLEVIKARASVGGNFLAGIATNEFNPDKEIDMLSKTLDHVLENPVSLPRDFYGVGGMKIFRDLIYEMRGFLKADHKFFKSHGYYDFPQRKVGNILLMKLAGMALRNKKLKKKMGNKFNEGMISPYKKVLEKY